MSVALDSWAALAERVQAHMHALGAHPGQTVVVLPFFQLQALARQAWLARVGAQGVGFLPRFETTTSWHRRVAHFVPQAWDLRFDAALDALTGRELLRRAGLTQEMDALLPLLLEAAQQLGLIAAAVEPAQRPAWAQALRGVSGGGATETFARYEAALARLALEWAAASRYASDALIEQVPSEQVQALVVVRGVQPNALVQLLAQRMGERALVLDLPQFAHGALRLHQALDAEEEAQRASACVVAHLAQGRAPVALPALDRLVTRRISAMLSQRGVTLHDETGWNLSTTHAGASLMSLLRAAAPQASRDEQLQWLKCCAVSGVALSRWEQRLRGAGAAQEQADAQDIEFLPQQGMGEPGQESGLSWRSLLAQLRAARSVGQWLLDLERALRISGQWLSLAQDAAGVQVLAALHCGAGAAQEVLEAGGAQSMSLAQFSAWVELALEGSRFKPPQGKDAAQVVILPLAQMAGRPFAAAVIAGADEVRLPLAPDGGGGWSTAQREALGLPSRAALAAQQQQVWQRSMQVAQVDVLWRSSEGDVALAPSPLLQLWLMNHAADAGLDMRERRVIAPLDSAMPSPAAQDLLGPVALHLSASSYADLRACPYRFFALRLLGLQEAQELDEGLSKRDFGAWLHAVLDGFHRQRRASSTADTDREQLDQCAQQELARLGSDPSFVPFAASWPQVREGYLLWLAEHEAQGWRFESSEHSCQRELGEGVQIKGRLDRVDVLIGQGGQGAQRRAVLDYKTQSKSALAKRVADPLEDTQLVFYAALLGGGDVAAFYVALAEGLAESVEQGWVNEALPILLEGLADDVRRIGQGHGLAALGAGSACDYCAARGLCRKDFWSSV